MLCFTSRLAVENVVQARERRGHPQHGRGEIGRIERSSSRELYCTGKKVIRLARVVFWSRNRHREALAHGAAREGVDGRRDYPDVGTKSSLATLSSSRSLSLDLPYGTLKWRPSLIIGSLFTPALAPL